MYGRTAHNCSGTAVLRDRKILLLILQVPKLLPVSLLVSFQFLVISISWNFRG